MMNEYAQVMDELNAGIRELQNLKKTIATDAATQAAGNKWKKIGSAAMIQRTKLNIRDSFRRIESHLTWESGKKICSYNQLVIQGGKMIKEGEE